MQKEFEKLMMRNDPKIQIICADAVLAERYAAEIEPCYQRQITFLPQVAKARRNLRGADLSVILLDESAVKVAGNSSLESTVTTLTETAPIVVVAAPERQSELAFLITSGAADFVVRRGHFVAVAAGLVERRIHMAGCAAEMLAPGGLGLEEDFGEILRHEVNNPLTGILGNAELLLARREGLPPAAIARVETIAELAVRLRETVRRLSSAWVVRHDHVSS
jgi:signal transduction histidine kinase